MTIGLTGTIKKKTTTTKQDTQCMRALHRFISISFAINFGCKRRVHAQIHVISRPVPPLSFGPAKARHNTLTQKKNEKIDVENIKEWHANTLKTNWPLITQRCSFNFKIPSRHKPNHTHIIIHSFIHLRACAQKKMIFSFFSRS